MSTLEALDSESLLALNFSFDGSGGARLSSGPEGISAQPDLGDFLGCDWSSYLAAFPSDKHEFDGRPCPSDECWSGNGEPFKCFGRHLTSTEAKEVDGNNVTDDERSRKKSKRNGIDESDVRTVIMSRERAKCSVRRKCATSPPH